MPRETILVTGGAGFIGSHTCVELLKGDYDVIVVDNLSNSCEESLTRVEKICDKTLKFLQVDLLDEDALDKVFSEHPSISTVIHFAGLKAVGESVAKPLSYYHNNIGGTIVLLRVMQKYKVWQIVFSSSATVYGNPKKVPLTETDDVGGCSNPYGKTKLFIEEILKDWATANNEARVVLLRYFNPVGAHKSGLIGEDPIGRPNNLMPFVAQVAVGRLPKLQVFGNDYDTPDGTGVRDYIHVVDLAKGHIAALRYMSKGKGCYVFNLGLGRGYSVLEMVEAMKKASQREIPYEVVGRRAGDIACCYADTTLAKKELGWSAELGLPRMCEDIWRWQSMNPYGYSVGTPPDANRGKS